MLKKKIITKITGIKEIIDLGEGKSTVLRMMTRKRGHLKPLSKLADRFICVLFIHSLLKITINISLMYLRK